MIVERLTLKTLVIGLFFISSTHAAENQDLTITCKDQSRLQSTACEPKEEAHIPSPDQQDPASIAFHAYLARIAPMENSEGRKNRRENWKDKVMVITPFATMGLYTLKSSCPSLSASQLGGGLVASWLLADLVTGVVHFTFDALDWKNPRWPLEMRKAALTFQWHHDFPSAATKSTFWGLSREFYMMSTPFLAISCGLAYAQWDMSAYILATTALMGAQAHYTHALSHGKHINNPLVRFLHRFGIIQSPRSHKIHHIDTNKHYCLFNGHTNFVFDPLVRAGRTIYNFFYGEKSEKKE